MPESYEWGFRPVIDPSDLPQPDASDGDLHQFANSLDGYQVWGDDHGVARVSHWVMQHLDGTRACTSVLKLRTALFWHARRARMTDKVGPSLMPEEAAFGPEMRAILRQLRRCMTEEPADDKLVAQIVESAASGIPDVGPFAERDLRDAILEQLVQRARHSAEQAALAGAEVGLGQLPGWASEDPPGRFDLAFGLRSREATAAEARALAEVKWSDHNTLSHSLWDAAKLIGALAKCADHAYLIGGWPVEVWARAPCAALYQAGVMDFAALAALPGEWPSLDKHGQGRALAIPNDVRINDVAAASVLRGDHTWELRAVSIEPAAGGWLWLNDGLVEGAIPYRERDNAGR